MLHCTQRRTVGKAHEIDEGRNVVTLFALRRIVQQCKRGGQYASCAPYSECSAIPDQDVARSECYDLALLALLALMLALGLSDLALLALPAVTVQ